MNWRALLASVAALAVVFFGGRPLLVDAGIRENDAGKRESAASYFGAACALRDFEACYYLGIQYRAGEGVPQDLAKAADLYRRACDAEQFQACTNLGYLHGRGLGTKKDSQEALRLYTMGCGADREPARRDPTGCANAASVAFELGHLDQAAALSRLACEADEPMGCLLSGEALHAAAPADEVASARAFRKACGLGIGKACFNLGINSQAGVAGPVDEQAARRFYGQACDAGYPAGCTNLAFGLFEGLDGGAPRVGEAEALWRQACQAGDGKGCVVIAERLFRGDGGQVEALAMLEQACDGGSSEGCHHLGVRVMDRDPARGLALCLSACERGEGGACLAVADSPANQTPLAQLHVVLDRALAERPDDLWLLKSRALLSIREGRDQESRSDFDRVLTLRPDDANSLNNRAWLNVLVGDFARALTDANRAVELEPRGSHLGTRCFAHAGSGDLKKAKADCMQALKLNPGERLNLGMLAFLESRHPEVRKHWDEAIRVAPSDRRAVEPWLAKLKK